MNMKSFNKPVDYAELKQSTRHYKGEGGYCSVIALAIAAGCKFGKARGIMSRHGRANGDGSYLPHIEAALEETPLRIVRKFNLSSRLNTVHNKLPTTGIFYIITKGHITCIRDGVNHDWSADKRLRGSGRLVQEVWELSRT
jgi:hypothetical protein